MSSPLFKGGYDFSIEYCANCGRYMTVRYNITIDDQKFKVCSSKCEEELRAKQRPQEDES